MRAACRLAAAAALVVAAVIAASAAPLTLAVMRAEVGQVAGMIVLDMTLTASSAKDFAAFTTANVGRAVELRIDGKVMMAPVVREPILGGHVQISGNFAKAELVAIASRISTGEAKVEVESVAD